MKKFLLTLSATFMVVMGASAQRIHDANGKMQFQPESFKLEKVMAKENNAFVSHKANKTRRAEATETIDGMYILNAQNFEGDFVECSTFSVYSESGSINLDQYEGNPVFPYNVVLEDFTSPGATVYGYYDSESGYIEIPVQTIFTHNTYKEIVISGGYRSGAESVGYGKPIYLIVNGDGTMDIYEDAEEEGDVATTGWVSFLPNYEKGGLWNYGFDISVMQPNATMIYETTSTVMGGTSNDDWTEVGMRVKVEDYDDEWVINNFLGLTTASVTLNSDQTCYMELGQKMYDYDRDEPYGYYRLVGISIQSPYIVRNYDKEHFNGLWEKGLVRFFKTEYRDAWTDESGEHKAGYYYVNDDDDYCPYVAIASASDSEGGAYSLGYAYGIMIETDEHASAGINELTVDKKDSNKVYNLMGQQVKNAKGIIIRDSKKIIKK